MHTSFSTPTHHHPHHHQYDFCLHFCCSKAGALYLAAVFSGRYQPWMVYNLTITCALKSWLATTATRSLHTSPLSCSKLAVLPRSTRKALPTVVQAGACLVEAAVVGEMKGGQTRSGWMACRLWICRHWTLSCTPACYNPSRSRCSPSALPQSRPHNPPTPPPLPFLPLTGVYSWGP